MTNWTSSTDHQRALAESRRAERRKRQKLERDIAAARRESKKYRLEAARHRNACKALRAEGARLKEESARHRDMWSARGKGVPEWEMGDAPADPRAIHAHVMEVLAAIRRDKDLPREVSDLARKKMGVVLGRLVKGGGKKGANPPFAAKRAAAGRKRGNCPRRAGSL